MSAVFAPDSDCPRCKGTGAAPTPGGQHVACICTIPPLVQSGQNIIRVHAGSPR